MQKAYPIWEQNVQNWFPISDQNGFKIIPFEAEQTYKAGVNRWRGAPRGRANSIIAVTAFQQFQSFQWAQYIFSASNCLTVSFFSFSVLFRNFTWFGNYEYGNCYVFGAENMTQNISAPGNQNGELLHLIMYNHLSKIAVTGMYLFSLALTRCQFWLSSNTNE